MIFTNYVSEDGTVLAPATADSSISVVAYDVHGIEDPVGALAFYSARGKSIDGRRIADIAAPSGVYCFLSRNYSDQPGGYCFLNGTSFSLPHVVGCAALVKQINPDISSAELEDLLVSYTAVDEFTGPVPNDSWGYGKLRIYDSLTKSGFVTYVENKVSQPEAFQVSESYPNPFNSAVHFSMTIPSETDKLRVVVYNILGQKVFGRTIEAEAAGTAAFSWNGTDENGVLPSGIYLFRFIAEGAERQVSVSRRALFLK